MARGAETLANSPPPPCSDDGEAYEERMQSAFELEFLSVLDKVGGRGGGKG